MEQRRLWHETAAAARPGAARATASPPPARPGFRHRAIIRSANVTHSLRAGAAMYWIGTSGYNYPEWRGSFYPERFASAKMLPYYAERFRSVEVNYTFYRMPTASLLAGWAAATPDPFRFTLKAPQRITHVARLRACEPELDAFCRAASALGPKLGALLFQLPPGFRKDLPALEAFLRLLSPAVRPAFEFRHTSWHDPEVMACLRAHGAALCVADSEKLSTPIEVTAGHAYFRLRDEGYQDPDIARWAGTIRRAAAGCADVFVYFKHEEQGVGPAFASRLRGLLED
ncbi:MAG: hypothetical protein H6Q10_666 [Acidobacteria bacterium]|jgi:uncharacterized protein YecE (DUF72 family)|nr:hypothetical protein [Acidobacteriota bacterium]